MTPRLRHLDPEDIDLYLAAAAEAVTPKFYEPDERRIEQGREVYETMKEHGGLQ
jgi:hypothetical protein